MIYKLDNREIDVPDDVFNNILEEWGELWFSYIKEHPEIKWDWDYIGRNPNMTCNMIEKYATRSYLNFMRHQKKIYAPKYLHNSNKHLQMPSN